MRLKQKSRLIRSGALIEAFRQIRHIAASAASPWRHAPSPGHLRGIDFYNRWQFIWAFSSALHRYKSKFGTYPNVASPSLFNEKVFWFKFFGELSIPGAGNKLTTSILIPTSLRDKLPCLPVVWQSQTPRLPDNSAIPPGVYYLKANLGSDMFMRVEFPLSLEQRRNAESKAKTWLSSDYGFDNGEWWYHTFQPEIFLERSVAGTKEAISWNFHALNGEIPMIGLFLKHVDGSNSSTWLDSDFRPLPWCSDLPTVKDFRITEIHRKMLNMASVIGQSLPFVRIDFLEGDDGQIYLCELTFAPGDGLTRRPLEVEALLAAPWKVLK